MSGRLAIFGGTFNPIHKGHIRLAQAARDEMGLERVLLIPTWTPPHKESPDLAPSQHRLAMCRLAAEGHPFLEVDDLEIRRRGRSYTIDTVEELGRREPGRELVLIVGSDMLLTFHQWRRWRAILERVTLCAACREPAIQQQVEDYARRLEGEGYRCRLLTLPPLQLSSTQIRRGIADGTLPSGWLDDKVEAYIREHGLYTGKKEEGEG